MSQSMKIPGVMLGTLITSINVATLLAGTVAVFGSMNPTGANAAPSGIDDSVQLLVLWQPLPLWTIMQAGTGKCSSLCGVSVVLLASRTLPKFLMFLPPLFLNLLLSQGSLLLAS